MEEKTITLSLKTLIRECALDNNLDFEHQSYFSLKNRENVHEVFRYQKFNEDFCDTLVCYRTEKDLVGFVRPSYEEFLKKIARYLNIELEEEIKDEEELTKRLLERVKTLSKISSEQELKEEFPLISKDLNDGRNYLRSLEKLRKQEKITNERFVSGEHYFYGCALKRGLSNFLKTQTVAYKRFIIERKKYQEKIKETSFNAYIKENFDMEKFYLYVMHEYLNQAEKTQDNAERKKYVDLVEKYFSSTKDKGVSITIEGMKITRKELELRLSHLKDRISSQKRMVDWIILPEGRDYQKVSQEETSGRALKMTKEEVERLKAKGERKRAFYESTPYLAKAIGLKRYHGYIAYIYENGEVILDREYMDKYPSTAIGNAIYNMRIRNFEQLSRCDKKTLMKDSRVKRISHKKGWEEKAKEIIEKKAAEEEKEETKQMVKRLRRRA